MPYRLIVEVEKMSDILQIVEFSLKLGASIKIEPKLETRQGVSAKQEDDQKED